MKKMAAKLVAGLIIATTLMTTKADAWVQPPLSCEAREVLDCIAYHGRSALIWFDCDGHTHISLVNDGVDLRTVLPGEYTGCTMSGGRIVICKESCDCYIFNGVPVTIYPIDCHDRHLFIVPTCG